MARARKKGKGYDLRVCCGYDVDGKRIEKYRRWLPDLSMTPKQAEKEAKRQLVLFEDEVKRGKCHDNTTRFHDLAELCMQEFEPRLAPKTYIRYGDYLRRINKAIGNVKIRDLTPIQLNAFYRSLARDGSNHKPRRDENGNVFVGGGLAPKTIVEHHRLISKILNTAIRWGMIEGNVASRADPPKLVRQEIKYLDERQTAHMIGLLKHEPIQYRTMILMLLYTGMRRGELCGLEWKDIDFTERRLSVIRTSQYIGHGQIITKEPKTRSGRRELSLSATACTMLKDYKVWQNTQRLRVGEEWVNTDRLFTQCDGKPIYPDMVTEWFGKFLKRHGLPKVTLHSLRHTNATLMIAEGVDICTVSKRLGHANTSITLDVYAHALKTKDSDAADRLEAVLSGH